MTNNKKEMRQDYYHGNWYEAKDPDPPTFHQSKGINWGLILAIILTILLWTGIFSLLSLLF